VKHLYFGLSTFAAFFGSGILRTELQEAARSDLWRIREAAAWALGFRQDVGDSGVLRALARDPVPDVRDEAEASIQRLGALGR